MPANHVITWATFRGAQLVGLTFLKRQPFLVKVGAQIRPHRPADQPHAQQLVTHHCAAETALFSKKRDLLDRCIKRHPSWEGPQLCGGNENLPRNIVAVLLDLDARIYAANPRVPEPQMNKLVQGSKRPR